MSAPESSTESSRRSGFVSVIGRTNAGKSTFVNTAVGEKVAIVTPKPQTTRDRIQGIITRPQGQIILVDTPGIHNAKGRPELNRRMVQSAMATLMEVDCIVHIVDATVATRRPEKIHPLDHEILKGIAAAKRPALLVLNKVDKLKKPALLPILETFAPQIPEVYTHIIPASAKDGSDVNRILDLVYTELPDGPDLYPPDQISDRTDRFLSSEIVREQVFLQMRQELPYGTAVEIETYEEEGKRVRIGASILVERDSHKGMLIGKGGENLRKMGSAARLELNKLLGKRVHLELYVKTDTRWTNAPEALSRLGYDRVDMAPMHFGDSDLSE